MSAPVTTIWSIGTAVPRHRFRQSEVPVRMRQLVPGLTPALTALMDRFYAGSGIHTRHSVLPDVTGPDEAFRFLPGPGNGRRSPTTAERMALYRREAPALARAAAESALADCPAGTHRRITHLVVVSCTGFFSPGPDVELVRGLELRPDVHRQIIGFMGCHAAFNGLRAADDICRARPDAVVLLVCVELCSLHFQFRADANDLLADCLFADGAAAAVVSAAPPPPNSAFRLLDSQSHLLAGSESQIGWVIHDTGFRMTLSPEVPATLGNNVGGLAAGLLRRNGRRRRDVAFWALHPGGRRIVDGLCERLSVTPEQAEPARSVLREFGNMSSPTILFVLKRCLEAGPAPGALGMALAFGPGVTVESMLLQVPAEADRAG